MANEYLKEDIAPGLLFRVSASILTYGTDNLLPLKVKYKMDCRITPNHTAPDGHRYILVLDPHEKTHEY